jgi:hypothetical protein
MSSLGHLTAGGPVFPATWKQPVKQLDGSVAYADASSPGMTLRDYFATAAMPLAWEIEKERPTGPYKQHMEPTYEGAATRAYYFADAMLKAREQK